MPEMSGQALAEWMRDGVPDLPVLYMSGYSDDVLGDHGTLAPGTSFLPKPFRATTLFGAVHQALTGNAR